MKSLFIQSEGGKIGGIDGLNLFFGALLGANLGTMQGMRPFDYGKMIVLLAGTVMVLRMISTSKRRVYMLLTLAVYVGLFAAMTLVPKLQPKGMAVADLHRLMITLGVWVVLVLATELWPTSPDADFKPSEE